MCAAMESLPGTDSAPVSLHIAARLVSKSVVFSTRLQRWKEGHYGFSVRAGTHGCLGGGGDTAIPVVSLESICEDAVVDSRLRDGDIIEAINNTLTPRSAAAACSHCSYLLQSCTHAQD